MNDDRPWSKREKPPMYDELHKMAKTAREMKEKETMNEMEREVCWLCGGEEPKDTPEDGCPECLGKGYVMMAPDEIEVSDIVYHKHLSYVAKEEAMVEAHFVRTLSGDYARVRKFEDRWYVYRAKRQ